MKVIICKDYEEASEKAAEIVISLVKSNPKAVLGLPTGTTPLGLYRRLIKDHKENGTSYKEIKTANLDEYKGLDINSDQSYIYFMRHNLFEGLDIDLKNTHIENGAAADGEKECAAYDKLLETMVQDLQVLGIGSNGHIGFNEPNTPFDMGTHQVKLTENTIKDNSRLFKSIDEVPRYAYTMGPKNIMNAKKILMIATGKNKAKAVYDMIKGKVDPASPASILQNHPDCTVILDEDSASLIK